MKPASTLHEPGVGLAPVSGIHHAIRQLAHGQRAERRAALRYLRKHRKELTPEEAAQCRLK